jgi:carbon storage regulator
MLVMTRTVDDQIVIGPGITITIAGIRRDQVQIGIDAPRSVRIMRQELTTQTADKGPSGSGGNPPHQTRE